MKNRTQSCEKTLDEFNLELEDLRAFASRSSEASLNERQSRELIDAFEKTHELALSVIKKYFAQIGIGPFSGSRDLTVEAFHADLVDDGKAWLDIVIDRIQYNPIYDIDTQEQFITNIKKKYMRLLEKFSDTMGKKLNE